MLHEIRVSGTVLCFPAKNRGSGNRVRDFRVSGGPPVRCTRCPWAVKPVWAFGICPKHFLENIWAFFCSVFGEFFSP